MQAHADSELKPLLVKDCANMRETRTGDDAVSVNLLRTMTTRFNDDIVEKMAARIPPPTLEDFYEDAYSFIYKLIFLKSHNNNHLN